ncbi:MAG: lactate utilization protein [Gammaproteobacteria bacterium]
MNDARKNILERLRQTPVSAEEPVTLPTSKHVWSRQQKIDHLRQCMTAVRSEVHYLSNESWIDWINRELPARGFQQILVGDNAIADQLQKNHDSKFQVNRYNRKIEDWKTELFHQIDVSITSTIGAIADTGSLILWPDEQEPRLMSLVPPVHVALLHADQIHQTFAEAIDHLNWAENTPTNALLISGPSKTSDIEQTLAFGIHGPRQLIVLIIDCES